MDNLSIEFEHRMGKSFETVGKGYLETYQEIERRFNKLNEKSAKL